MRICTVAVFGGILLTLASAASGRTVFLELGDRDGGVYDGIGSIDDVYIDPAWFSELVNPNISDFDVSRRNHAVPMTFEFVLAPGESVTGAILTAAICATDSNVSTDTVRLETVAVEQKYDMSALGWLPIPQDQFVIRSMDLATALGRNRLPELQDGQLNVSLGDDLVVDYASLELTIVPEPAGLLACSAVVVGLLRPRRPRGEN